MSEFITLILGKLTLTEFIASMVYLLLGLQLNVGMGALRRLTAKRVRKYNRKIFLCRCYVSLIGGVIIILLFNQIFGRPLTFWAVCAAGIAIDLAIENLFTFARDYYTNNQNSETMTEEILEDVFLIESNTDTLPLDHDITVTEFARKTNGVLLPVEGEPEIVDGTARHFELRYPQGMAPIQILDLHRSEPVNGEITYFIGHVPRPPRKPGFE